MAAEPILLDTNVIVRLVTGDDPVLSPAAGRFITEHEFACRLTAATISEVVFVVRGAHYGWDRGKIVLAIRGILDSTITVIDRPVVERALDLFEQHHSDWDDCLLAAYAMESTEGRVASFDRGLGRIPGITILTPA